MGRHFRTVVKSSLLKSSWPGCRPLSHTGYLVVSKPLLNLWKPQFSCYQNRGVIVSMRRGMLKSVNQCWRWWWGWSCSLRGLGNKPLNVKIVATLGRESLRGPLPLPSLIPQALFEGPLCLLDSGWRAGLGSVLPSGLLVTWWRKVMGGGWSRWHPDPEVLVTEGRIWNQAGQDVRMEMLPCSEVFTGSHKRMRDLLSSFKHLGE